MICQIRNWQSAAVLSSEVKTSGSCIPVRLRFSTNQQKALGLVFGSYVDPLVAGIVTVIGPSPASVAKTAVEP